MVHGLPLEEGLPALPGLRPRSQPLAHPSAQSPAESSCDTLSVCGKRKVTFLPCVSGLKTVDFRSNGTNEAHFT